jgi:hypothetical protein
MGIFDTFRPLPEDRLGADGKQLPLVVLDAGSGSRYTEDVDRERVRELLIAAQASARAIAATAAGDSIADAGRL